MPTHQEIAGVSDEDLVNRMISSYADRFDDAFWDYYGKRIEPGLPDTPVIVDIGCGPGLLLRDLSARHKTATLAGTDVTRAMIDYAEALEYPGAKPTFHLHDVTKEPLPFEDGSVDLVSMVAVLHVLPDANAVLTEIRRVLGSGGQFLLQDWIRTPLPIYLERMMPKDVTPEQKAAARKTFLALFSVHNKYTKEDWLWLLEEGGFDVMHRQELRSPHFCAYVCTAR